MLSATFNEQIIGCAALLLATVILRFSSTWFRCAFFIVVFGCGVLAVASDLATSLGDAAVERLFQ